MLQTKTCNAVVKPILKIRRKTSYVKANLLRTAVNQSCMFNAVMKRNCVSFWIWYFALTASFCHFHQCTFSFTLLLQLCTELIKVARVKKGSKQ